jgi:hypothetical protein
MFLSEFYNTLFYYRNAGISVMQGTKQTIGWAKRTPAVATAGVLHFASELFHDHFKMNTPVSLCFL